MSKQIGVLSTKTSRTLEQFPIPEPGPGEVLIKNIAVASNPKDWKVPNRFDTYSAIEGNDVAGTVAAVGEGVTEFKKGDRVAAFSKMATRENKYGAYAEYTVAPAETTFPLGSNTLYEDAATLPLAVMTAAIGLFVVLGLPAPPEEGLAPPIDQAVIIYGASTSVGSFAVQLAKRAGFFVVGVAGDSAEYAKSIGADIVINYKKEKNLEKALVAAVDYRPAAHAYDAVCLNQSTVLLARVLTQTSPTKSGKVTFVGFPSDEEKALIPSGIEAERTGVNSAYGKDIEFAAKYYRLIGKWLDDGSFKPNNVRVLPNGLASVDKGINMLYNGDVHAEKLVYRIAETPQLKA